MNNKFVIKCFRKREVVCVRTCCVVVRKLHLPMCTKYIVGTVMVARLAYVAFKLHLQIGVGCKFCTVGEVLACQKHGVALHSCALGQVYVNALSIPKNDFLYYIANSNLSSYE